jgi:hypothetical protein
MTFTMQNLESLSLAEMIGFVEGNRGVRLIVCEKDAVHALIESALKAQRYLRLSKAQRGVVRSFLLNLAARSGVQLSQLMQCWRRIRHVLGKPSSRRR